MVSYNWLRGRLLPLMLCYPSKDGWLENSTNLELLRKLDTTVAGRREDCEWSYYPANCNEAREIKIWAGKTSVTRENQRMAKMSGLLRRRAATVPTLVSTTHHDHEQSEICSLWEECDGLKCFHCYRKRKIKQPWLGIHMVDGVFTWLSTIFCFPL